MVKWLVPGLLLLALVVALLWSSAPNEVPVPTTPVQQKVVQPPGQRKAPVVSQREAQPVTKDAAPQNAANTEDAAGIIDTASDEFTRILDEIVPSRFRNEVAKCDYQGHAPNDKVKIHYTLRIVEGEVFATKVRLGESDLNDPVLEQCMVSAVEKTRWRSNELPDWAEEEETLFLRIRMFKKFQGQDEDEDED